MSALMLIQDVVIKQDEEGRYCLNDLHKAAIAKGTATKSQAPAQFLKSAQVQRYVDKVTDMTNITSVQSIRGGANQGTYADELVAIRYAAWIDTDFELEVYNSFRQKVSNRAYGGKGLENKHQAEALKIAMEAAQMVTAMLPNLGDASKQCLVASFVNPIAGYEAIALPKIEEKFYTTTELSEVTLISPQMVGRLANAHSMKQEQYGEYRLSKSQHSSKQVEQWFWNQDGFDAMCNLIATREQKK